MAYQDQGRRPRSGSSRTGSSSSQYTGAARARVPSSGVYHGPTGTRTRPKSSLRGSSRGGYPLRSRSINFQGNRNRILGIDRRLVILGALAIVLAVLVIVGVSTCVRSCSGGEGTDTQTSQSDVRVAAGLSEELTNDFTSELDQNEKLATIAANADQYGDQGLLELALNVPEAIDFVAAYPTAEKTAQPYDEAVTKGTAPQLWCWDSRWGNVDYAGRALAITGSGPTALSMAYMGLTGATDSTPAEIAQSATDDEAATGDSAMTADFLVSEAEKLGLTCESFASNADNLSQMLDSGTYVLMETKAGSLTSAAHWVLVVTENEDGSMQVYDPTSPDVSAHPWAPATLASTCTDFYVLSVPGSDDDNADGTDDGASDSTSDSDASYE